MKLHPNPERTTKVLAQHYVDAPRCPASNKDGSQCKRSLFTGSPVDIILNGETVTVCQQHGTETE